MACCNAIGVNFQQVFGWQRNIENTSFHKLLESWIPPDKGGSSNNSSYQTNCRHFTRNSSNLVKQNYKREFNNCKQNPKKINREKSIDAHLQVTQTTTECGVQICKREKWQT